jgi:Flp pilus assembly protein TadD
MILGDRERSMGEYEKAHLAYVRAHFSDTESIAPLERIAYLTLRSDPAAASRLFEDLLDEAPDDASLLLGRAYAELAQGKIGPARATLEQAIRVDPSSSAAHAALAIVHDSQRHHQAAMASNALASEASAPTLQLLNNQGISSLMTGDSRRAIDFFKRANALSPESELAANNLGLALALEGYEDAAFEAFLLHGSRGDALNNLGVVFFLRGNSSKAREFFEQALLTSETDELRVLRNLERIDGLSTIR